MHQRITTRRLIQTLLFGAGLAATATAQTDLYTMIGDGADDRFGESVAAAGDVNNDGRPDFLVGASEDNAVFFSQLGYVRVYSGSTGAVLHTLVGTANGAGFGTSAAGVGDANLDGNGDVAVGAPFGGSGGQVTLFSGATGAPLWSFSSPQASARLGADVAAAGDVNGDGRADVIVGAFRSDAAGPNAGEAYVLSGLDGSILFNLAGAANSQYGVSVAGLGDLNADGRSDFAIGSRTAGVWVYSGLTGGVMFFFPPPISSDHYGWDIANAGDVDGDGKNDLVIGAPQNVDFFSPGPGYAHVRSGATGALLHTFTGDVIGDSYGYSVCTASDFDGDGREDVIIGATQSQLGGNGYARVLSGLDGSTLTTITGDAAYDRYGYSVAGLADVDGDGDHEIAIGGPTADPNNMLAAGMADVISGSGGSVCPQPTIYCTTTPNSGGLGARMTYLGTTSYGSNDLTLKAVRCPANTQGIFIISADTAAVPFGDGVLCLGGTVRRIMPPLTTGDDGEAFRTLDYAVPPSDDVVITPGSTWNFQFWYRDPDFGIAGFNLSDAMTVTFCP